MTLTAYQVGYDEKTRSECPNGFKLLDYNNELPHFKEIIPILTEFNAVIGNQTNSLVFSRQDFLKKPD